MEGFFFPTKNRNSRSNSSNAATAGSKALRSNYQTFGILARSRVLRLIVSVFTVLVVLPLLGLLASPAAAAAAEVESNLRWPVEGKVSATVSWHIANEGTHAVDIANNQGTPVAAAHGGTVVYAGTTSDQFSCKALGGKLTGGDGFG